MRLWIYMGMNVPGACLTGQMQASTLRLWPQAPSSSGVVM